MVSSPPMSQIPHWPAFLLVTATTSGQETPCEEPSTAAPAPSYHATVRPLPPARSVRRSRGRDPRTDRQHCRTREDLQLTGVGLWITRELRQNRCIFSADPRGSDHASLAPVTRRPTTGYGVDQHRTEGNPGIPHHHPAMGSRWLSYGVLPCDSRPRIGLARTTAQTASRDDVRRGSSCFTQPDTAISARGVSAESCQ
jgi:hypothetical protein